MKKIPKSLLSLTMLLLLNTTAFATSPTSKETPVTYSGIGTQTYELSVPAILQPSQSGEVKLWGTWDSTKVIKVTTDDTIIMTNNIDSKTKELEIDFNNIYQDGNNTTPIEVTENILVGEITDALFGTWNGTITYNISMETTVQPVYVSNFANNTWQQIATACQNNEVPETWNVGDIKTMEVDGVEYEVAIIGKNHDTYADGSGIAPLTFQLVDVLNTTYQMNSTNTNAGGWDGSAMYTTLNTTIFDTLEADVKDNIKAVSKVTNIGAADAGGTATTTRTTSDKLFLLSYKEAFNYTGTTGSAVYKDEGTQYEYYVTEANRIKDNAGVASEWWLRSPICLNSIHFGYAGKGGNIGNWNASSYYGVAFGFCF